MKIRFRSGNSSYHSSFRWGEAPLKQDLVAAQGHGLADFLEQDVAVEHIGFGVVDRAIEGAEIADRRADVGVVDVAVDVVGAVRLGMQPLADGICGAAKVEQAGLTEQGHTIVEAQAAAVNGVRKIAATVEDKVYSFRGQSEARRPSRRTAANRPAPAPRGHTRERRVK